MHPVLFRIPVPGWTLPVVGKVGAVPIYSYGVMLGLSLVVGWYLTLGLCQKDGLDRDQMANCYVMTAIAAVIGSRIAFLVTNPADLHSAADLFAFRGGGLVAYGGFIGGLFGSYGFLRWKKQPLLPWADAAVPSLASGLCITRVGCYLFGCDFGRQLGASAPAWLRRLGTFPRWQDGLVGAGTAGSPAWLEHVKRHLIGRAAAASLPVHPTQIYESLVGLALLGLLLWVRRRRRFPGEVFFIATFAYGLLRFLLEILRDDPERGSVPSFLPEHLLMPLCLALFAAGFSLGIARMIRGRLARVLAQVLSFIPAIAAAILLHPSNEFLAPEPVSLSTSQFLGLASALLVAALYWLHDRAAKPAPAGAKS